MQLEVNRKPIPKGTIMEKEALVNLLDQISIQCDPDNIDYTFPTVIIEDDNEARQVEQRYLLSDAETAERASWLKAQCQSAEAALDSISEQDFASSSQSVNKDVTPEAQAATEILHPYEELIDFLDCLKSEMQESQKAYLSERKDVRILSFLLDNEQAMQELVSIVSKSPTEQNIFSLFWGDNDYLTVKKYLAENQQGTPAFKLACTLFTETVLPNADVARKTLEKRKAALNQLEQDAIKKQFIFSWARYLGNPAIAKAGNFAHTVQLSLIAQELTGSMERAGFIDRIKMCFKYRNIGSDYSNTLSLLRNSQEKCTHHLHDCKKRQDRDSYLYENSDKIIAENSRTISIQEKRRQDLAPQISDAEKNYAEKKAAADEVRARRSKESRPYQSAVDRLQDQIDREKQRKERYEEGVQRKYDRIRKSEGKIVDLEGKIYEYERKIYNSDEETSGLQESIDDFQERIDDLRDEIEGLEREIDEIQSDIRDCERTIRDLESEFSVAENDLRDKHAEFEPDLSPKRAAEQQARSVLRALNGQDRDALSLIQAAQTKIDECVHLQEHSEVLREQALEISQTTKAIDDSKEVIEQANRSIPSVQKIDTLYRRTRRNIYIFCATSLAIILALTLILTGIFSQSPKTASSSSHSKSYPQKQEESSYQPTSSPSASASKSVDETDDTEDTAEAIAQRGKVPVPSSHTIETRYYTVKVPDATDKWTYDYVNAYSTSSWDGKGGLGYITYIYRNDALIYEIACFGGVATPGKSDASVLVGTLDVPGTGELSVFAVVPIDREGPNADVAVSNAVDEANYYAENVNLNPDYTATAAETESTGTSDGDEYVLPASDSKYFTRDQLEGLSDWELYLARNEVFARHGRQFKNDDLADYFSSQPWYNGEYSPEDFDGWFSPNEYEKANTDLIMEIEHERNSPYLS